MKWQRDNASYYLKYLTKNALIAIFIISLQAAHLSTPSHIYPLRCTVFAELHLFHYAFSVEKKIRKKETQWHR